MQITLDFGRTPLTVDLPPGARPTFVRKPAMVLPADPGAAIDAALNDPIGCAPLSTLAQGARTACILICDITRPVPNGLFLRPMIETMLSAGVPAAKITVLASLL